MKKPTDNKQHARQFLTAPLFKTYDAIVALVKRVEKEHKMKGLWRVDEPLIFTGSEIRLAKKNGTSNHTEMRHIKRLVEQGWLIQIAGQRRSDGSFGTKQYRVVLVEEWETTHTFVPKSRKKNSALRKTNARRHLKRLGIDAEPFVDAYLHPLKRTVEQNTSPAVEQNTSPAVAHDTSTAVAHDTSTAVEQNTSQPLHKIRQGSLYCESIEASMIDVSQSVQASTSESDRQTNQPSCSLEDFQPKAETAEQLEARKLRELDDDWAFKKSRAEYEARKQRGDEWTDEERAAWSEEYNRQFPSPSTKAARIDALKDKNKTNAARWEEFRRSKEADLCDEMKNADPTPEERDAVLSQINEIGAEYLGQAVNDWAEKQSPPLRYREWHRWGFWLEKCDLSEAREMIELDKKMKAKAAAKK